VLVAQGGKAISSAGSPNTWGSQKKTRFHRQLAVFLNSIFDGISCKCLVDYSFQEALLTLFYNKFN